MNVYYLTHVQTYGWQGNKDNYKTWKRDGEIAGTARQAKRLEGIQIVLVPKGQGEPGCQPGTPGMAAFIQ